MEEGKAFERRVSLQSAGSFRSAASLSGVQVRPATVQAHDDEKRWDKEQGVRPESTQGIEDMKLNEILRMVFNKLDGGKQNQVQRQDLLSISAKVRDEELMSVLRGDKWLKPLLQPEVWGRQLLKRFNKGGFISFESFLNFWEQFQTEYSEYTGGDMDSRRDSMDSWRSFASSSSSQVPPNINFPGGNGSVGTGQRKILRALSVRSRSSEAGSVSGGIRHEDVDRRGIAVRVSVQAGNGLGVSPQAPPQVVAVPSSLKGLIALTCERLGIAPCSDLIIIHSALRAQVTQLDDLREGDSLKIVRRRAADRVKAAKGSSARLSRQQQQQQQQKGGKRKSNQIEDQEEQAEQKQEGQKEGDSRRSKGLSSFATFVRRPSWNVKYSSSPLPAASRHNLKSILAKVALSSNRWQRVHGKEEGEDPCPELSELKDRLVGAALPESMTLDKVFETVQKLGISFGLGRSHLRVLFDAVDRESTGTISSKHFSELVVLWHEVWAEHQARVCKIEEAIKKSRAREHAAPIMSGIASEASNRTERPKSAGAVKLATGSLPFSSSSSASSSSSSLNTPTAGAARGTKPLAPFCSKVSSSASHNVSLNRDAGEKGERVTRAKREATKTLRRLRPVSASPASFKSKVTGPSFRATTPTARGLKRPMSALATSGPRPSTAPASQDTTRDDGGGRVRPRTEEEFLRELHKTETDNTTLLLGYATYLLKQVEKQSPASRGPATLSLPSASAGDIGDDTSLVSREAGDEPPASRLVAPSLEPAQMKRVKRARELLKRALSASNLEKHVAKRTGDSGTLNAVRETRAEIMCRLAETCELMGSFSQSRSLYHKAIEEDPSNASILTRYGTFLHKIKDDAGAREYFLEALVHDKNCIGALLGYAVLLSTSSDAEDREQAAMYFRRARAVAAAGGGGARGGSKELRARVLAQVGMHENEYQGRHEEAIKTLEKAIELDPSFEEAYFELGRLKFAAKQDISGAVLAFEGAVRADPNHAKSLVALAQIFANSAEKADVQRADALFKRACEQDTCATRHVLSYAEFCSKVLRAEYRAEELFERAFDGASDALRPMCLYKWAEAFERKADRIGDGSCRMKAVALFEKAASLQEVVYPEGTTAYLVAFGKSALKANMLSKAKEALRAAMDADPTSVTAKWLSALTEQHLGRRSKAGKLFRAAYEEAPDNGFVMVHFARFLLDYRGAPDSSQEEIAEHMLRKALRLKREADKAAGGGAEPPLAYFESYQAMAMATLGKLLCQGTKAYLEGLGLLVKACERCPKAAEPKYLYAECLSMDLFHERAALYPAPRSGGRARSELFSRVDNAVRNFASASELDEKSVMGPIKASTLLLYQAHECKNPRQRTELLERAQKFAEKAIKRATKALEAMSSKRQDTAAAANSNNDKVDGALSSTASRAARALASQSSEAHFVLGVCLERQQKMRDAITEFRNAMRRNPGHVLAVFHMARRKETDFHDLAGAEAAVMQALNAEPETNKGKSDRLVLCKQVLRAYASAESDFLASEGEASGADPQAARALVMHQTLAKKAQEIISA